MGNNMIHHRCLDVSPLPCTLHTQWVGFEVLLPCPLPPAAVATLGSGSCYFRVEGLVFRTV